MIKSTGIRDTVLEDHIYCPSWRLQLVGTLSPNDPAGGPTPVTWATLFGFPSECSEYSAEFHAEVQKVKSRGPKETSEGNFQSAISWSCNVQDSIVLGRQELGESDGGMSEVSTDFRKLLGLQAPAVAQLRLSSEKAALLDVWRKTPPLPEPPKCKLVWATMPSPSDFTDVVAALARTPTSWFVLDLHHEAWVAGPSQDEINALTTLACGRSYCMAAQLRLGRSMGRSDCCVTRSRMKFMSPPCRRLLESAPKLS